MKKILTSLFLMGLLAFNNASFAESDNYQISKYSVRASDGNMPMVHWAVVMAKEGKQAEISKLAGRYVAPEVANEEGTYALYGGIGVNNRNNMILLEIYENEEAYEKHVSSKGFLKYKKEREPIMKKLIILEAEPIALEQKNSGVGTIIYLNKFDIILKNLKNTKIWLLKKQKEQLKTNPVLWECILRLKKTIQKQFTL